MGSLILPKNNWGQEGAVFVLLNTQISLMTISSHYAVTDLQYISISKSLNIHKVTQQRHQLTNFVVKQHHRLEFGLRRLGSFDFGHHENTLYKM